MRGALRVARGRGVSAAPSATSVVQAIGGNTANPTFAAPTTAGNSILIVLSASSTYPTPTGFTLVYDSGVDANTGYSVRHYLKTGAPATTTVTAAFGAPWAMFELAGTANLASSGIAPSTGPGSKTVSVADPGNHAPSLAIFTGQTGNSGIISLPTGFTFVEQYNNAGGFLPQVIGYNATAQTVYPFSVVVASNTTYMFATAHAYQK